MKGKERKSENCLFLSRSPSPSLLLSHFSHFKLLSLVHVPSPHSGRLLPLWYRFRSRHRPPPAARRPRRQHRTPLDPGEKREREREREREFFLTLRERRFFFQSSTRRSLSPLFCFFAALLHSALRLALALFTSRALRGAPGPARDEAESEQALILTAGSAFFPPFARFPPPTDKQTKSERASESEREQSHGVGFFSPPPMCSSSLRARCLALRSHASGARQTGSAVARSGQRGEKRPPPPCPGGALFVSFPASSSSLSLPTLALSLPPLSLAARCSFFFLLRSLFLSLPRSDSSPARPKSDLPFPREATGTLEKRDRKRESQRLGKTHFGRKRRGARKKQSIGDRSRSHPYFFSSTSSEKNEKQNNEQVEASDKSLSARVTELEQAVARLSTNTSNPSS